MGTKLFQKQPIMCKVIYALLPILIYSIGAFGFRILFLTITSVASTSFFEYVFERKKKKKPISEAAIVTGMLFALILPSTIPFWIVIFGSAFGIIFAKEAFGGFGRNVFNPAMVGRTFLCQLSYCNDHGLDKTCKLLGTRIFEEFSN